MSGKSVAAGTGGEGDSLLALLDQRMRKVAEETFRSMASAGDAEALKIATAAKRLDMSESRLRALIAAGEIRAFRPTPNTLRVPAAEIRRYVEQQSSEGK